MGSWAQRHRRLPFPPNQTHLRSAQPGLPRGSKQLQQARLGARSCRHTSRPLISQAFHRRLYQTQLVGRARNLPASCTWPIRAACGGEAAALRCRRGRGSASRGLPAEEPRRALFVGCRFELPSRCRLPHLEPEVKADESGPGSAEACEARWECSQPARRAHGSALPQPGLLQLTVRGAIPPA